MSNSKGFLRKKASKHRYSWLENMWAHPYGIRPQEDKMNPEFTLSKLNSESPTLFSVDPQKAVVLFLRIALVVEGLGAGC